jgi:hypothetical protein
MHIELQSKLEHNLVKSDIYPRDRQNYRSCEKRCSSSVINKPTTTSDRLYHAWLAVFICRL